MKNTLSNIIFSKTGGLLAALGLLAIVLIFIGLVSSSAGKPIIQPKPTAVPRPNSTPASTTSASLQQGQDDYEYTQGVNSFYLSHPWYTKIPPKNSNYFIGFDATKNDFFVELYPTTSSPESTDQQVSQLKQQVIQELTSIGVDTTKYSIEWQIYPK